MINKHKKKDGVITVLAENIISDSVVFNLESNPRLMKFAVKDFYTTFKQEDMVMFRKGNNEYKVLVLAINHRVDTCFVRGLIKEDRILAGS